MNRSKTHAERVKYYLEHVEREKETCRIYHAKWRKKLLYLSPEELNQVILCGTHYAGAKGYTYVRFKGFQIKLHRAIYCIKHRIRLIDIEGYDIHHIDENIHNNSAVNLQKLTHEAHTKYTKRRK